MFGRIQDVPLVLTHFFERAERTFAEKELIDARADGRARSSSGAWADRTPGLAGVLDALGAKTSVGKFSKKDLLAEHGDHQWSESGSPAR